MLVDQIKKFLSKIQLAEQTALARIFAEAEAKEIKCEECSHDVVSHSHLHDAPFCFGINNPLHGSLPIVCSISASEENIVRVNNAEKLRREKELPNEFNYYPLYYDDKGRKIYPGMNGINLQDYMESNRRKLDLDTVKKIVGQIILALYDNHRRGIARLNIQPDHFLVFFINQTCHIKLANHHASIQIKKATGEALIPPDFFGVTYHLPYELQILRNPPEFIKSYQQSNFKKLDCYAMGLIFEEMVQLLQPELNGNSALERLAYDLMKNEMHIHTAMKSAFFGSTYQERKNFFNELRQTARDNILIIRGHPHVAVGQNDSFNILDDYSRLFYYATQKAIEVAKKIEECNQLIIEHCKKGRFSDIVVCFYSLEESKLQLLELVAASSEKINLKQLEQDAINETHDVFFRLSANKFAIAALLKKAVDEAYEDYVQINKLEPTICRFRFFHRLKGKEQARVFRQSIIELEDKVSPKEIFALIELHCKSAGRKEYPLSFKTILYGKLAQLSDRKMGQWRNYFEKLDYPCEIDRDDNSNNRM